MVNLLVTSCLFILPYSIIDSSIAFYYQFNSNRLFRKYRDALSSLSYRLNEATIESSLSRLEIKRKEAPNSTIDSSNKRIETDISNFISDMRNVIKEIKFDFSESTISPFFHKRLSQIILSWIIKMEKYIYNDNEFQKIISSIRLFVGIIEKKLISKKDISTIKLLKLFQDSNNSNDSLVSSIREFCHFYPNINFNNLILGNKFNDYDPHRVLAINTSMNTFNQKVNFTKISKIIGRYDQSDRSLNYVHEKVIKDLENGKGKKIRTRQFKII